MTRFRLRRLDSTANGTFGQLVDNEERLIALTLEEPWRDNARGISCIPPGVYEAHRRIAAANHHGYDVFELDGVPGRTAIQLHIGNTLKDTDGCILLGSNRGQIGGVPGIVGSASAFRRFMSSLAGVNHITVEVVDPPPSVGGSDGAL